jgi:ornithine decarboxylase
VKPFYAVKCNNLPAIVDILKENGAGFDCASSDEFVRARGAEIIYANPCKARHELYRAKDEGIQLATFDTLAELEKITHTLPGAKPILRLHIDDKGGARIPLNSKFGISVADLYKFVWQEPKFNICGIAFHVGSDCSSLASYQSAFDAVTDAVTILQGTPGFTPEVLDIGGGFSGKAANDAFFREKVAPLIQYRASLLPFERTIAEPGRFFAEESCSLHVPVIGRKTLPDGTEAITIDDSVYGMFSGVLMDGFVPQFRCVDTRPLEPQIRYTIFGRTCDSADRIATGVWLPARLTEGDVLEVPSIGAYSYVSASEFNGFPRPAVQVLL